MNELRLGLLNLHK